MAHLPTQLNSIHSGQATSSGAPPAQTSPPQLALVERVTPLAGHGELRPVGPELYFLLQDAWAARDFVTIRALLERRLVEPNSLILDPERRAVIVAERKLIEISLHVLLAAVNVRATHSAFEL